MRRRTAAVRALVSRDQWQAAARKWHTDWPARGEVAEPGLRRTPGERVNSEGFRGFKSPPLRHRVWLLPQSPENSAKWPALWPRFERPTEPERDEYRRHSTLCECFSP